MFLHLLSTINHCCVFRGATEQTDSMDFNTVSCVDNIYNNVINANWAVTK